MATQKQVFTEAHENIDKANHTTSGLIDYLRYIFGKLENATGGGGGGSEVSYTQTLTSGTETGTIEIDGVQTKMYAPTPAAPTEVEVTQVVSTGTKIATISVDDVPTDIYAPAGGSVPAFTLIDSVSGNNEIAIPAGLKELCLVIRRSNTIDVSRMIPTAMLSTTSIGIYDNSFLISNSYSPTYAIFDVTSTTAKAGTYVVAGSTSTNFTFELYGR